VATCFEFNSCHLNTSSYCTWMNLRQKQHSCQEMSPSGLELSSLLGTRFLRSRNPLSYEVKWWVKLLGNWASETVFPMTLLSSLWKSLIFHFMLTFSSIQQKPKTRLGIAHLLAVKSSKSLPRCPAVNTQMGMPQSLSPGSSIQPRQVGSWFGSTGHRPPERGWKVTYSLPRGALVMRKRFLF